MGGAQARRLCPWAIVVPPRMSAYSEASKAVFEVFDDTTPLVEGISIDEAFLDVGGLRRVSGTPLEIAVRLRERGPPSGSACPSPSAWPAPSSWPRWPAAVGKPDGLLVVPPDRELDFLHPLPVERLWGVGPITADKLRTRGILTVGEVAGLPEGALVSMLGVASGRHLHALAHNRDPRPVVVGRRRRSMGSQHALGRRPKSAADIDASLVALVDRVTRRMRAAGPGGPHRRPPPALRRLLPGHPLPHHRPGHGRHPGDPRRRPRPPRHGHAPDRAPGDHAGRRRRHQPRQRRRRPAAPARSTASTRPPSTWPSTTCGSGSAPRPSPGPCSSAATRA